MSASGSISDLPGFDWNAFSRSAKAIVADQWDVEATKLETIAGNLSDPAAAKLKIFEAKDLRDSAAALRRGEQP